MVHGVGLILHIPYVGIVGIERSILGGTHHGLSLILGSLVEGFCVHGSIGLVATHLLVELASQPRGGIEQHAGTQGLGSPVVGAAVGLALVVTIGEELDGTVEVAKDAAIHHILRRADGREVLGLGRLGAVRDGTPDVDHVEMVEGAEEVGLTQILVLLVLGQTGALAHIFQGVVADVDGTVEEFPIVVEAGIVGRIVLQGIGGEVILAERFLLVVITVVEKVGTHLAQSEGSLLAIPSAGKGVAAGHKTRKAGRSAIGEVGCFTHLVVFVEEVGT